MEMPSDPKAIEEARAAYESGLDNLRELAGLLRGSRIEAAPEAMATEIAVSRAIHALESAGFLRPSPARHVRFSGSIDDEE